METYKGIKAGKVVIIGAGHVGATTAYSLTIESAVSEIGLIDNNIHKAAGEALDLRDGLSFLRPMKIKTGGYAQCRDANIIIITAGINIGPENSRLDLAEKNAAIMEEIVPRILEHNPYPILIIATNPVDVLTGKGLLIIP